MTEYWVTIFGTSALAISAGELSIRPGLGRHQLVVPVEVRPTSELAHDHTYRFSGSLSATSLGRGSGYLGTFHESQPRRIGAHTQASEYLVLDINPSQLAAIEEHRQGGFSLDIIVEVKTESPADWGSTVIQGHPISRENWLRILEQASYQRTLLLELNILDHGPAPGLAKAMDHFADAQRRLLEGENRLAVEAARQTLAALVGQDPAEEEVPEELARSMKAGRSNQVTYDERFELVRRALKLLCDLGAHPEAEETRPAEARSAVVMVAGLLQWWAARSQE